MLFGTRLVCALGFLLPVFAASANLAAGPVATTAVATTAVGTLTVTDVKGLIDRNEAIYVYDANARESYLAGHVPGAQWIQYDAVTAAKLPKSKDAKLVFYCYNPLCGASPLAAKDAGTLGYRNIWLMPEGITGWRAARLPMVSGAKAR